MAYLRAVVQETWIQTVRVAEVARACDAMRRTDAVLESLNG
jgi:hypothetical protein